MIVSKWSQDGEWKPSNPFWGSVWGLSRILKNLSGWEILPYNCYHKKTTETLCLQTLGSGQDYTWWDRWPRLKKFKTSPSTAGNTLYSQNYVLTNTIIDYKTRWSKVCGHLTTSAHTPNVLFFPKLFPQLYINAMPLERWCSTSTFRCHGQMSTYFWPYRVSLRQIQANADLILRLNWKREIRDPRI